MNQRRVAITGIGIISSIGQTASAVSDSLKKGISGIGIDSERKQLGFRSSLSGIIRSFDFNQRFDRKERKTMGQAAAYGCAAAHDAIKDARLDPKSLARPEVGVVFGNDSTCHAAKDIFDTLKTYGRTQALGSGPIIQVMNSTVTMNLASQLGIQGACWTLSAACASGLHAIGQAAMWVGSGLQELVICGGAQETSWHGMAAFDALGALSTREDRAATASRPFDASRDGLVPSGGGAGLIVESLDSAKARGAKVYAEIVGYSFGCDGNHLTNPSGDGAVRVMRQALKYASIHPREVDYVNAHATSTPVGDAVEAQGIREVFGESAIPVSSTKGLTGHECWMSGASEVIYCLLMMQGSFTAGNPHLENPDPAAKDLFLPRTTLAKRPSTVVKNSFGFGGTNACLVLRTVD